MRSLLCTIVGLTLAAAATGCSGSNHGAIEASGTIEGTDIDIGSQVSGKILSVRVDEGVHVKPGDTLIVIDDTDYRLQLLQAEATMRSYEAAYRLVVLGPRKEDVVQAQAAYTTAAADFQRMKDLLASHTVTQKQYDETYARYVAAQQTYEKLKNGSRPEEISGARDHRAAAAAQVDLLQKRVHDCVITSPSAGIITLRSVEPGELVTVGSNLLRLTYLEKVKLMVYIDEPDLGKVRLGQDAEVRIDGVSRAFKGTVAYISPVAEFTPKNVQTKEERTKLVFGVRVEIDNPDGLLKPGMPADAFLPTLGKQG